MPYTLLADVDKRPVVIDGAGTPGMDDTDWGTA